MKIADVPLLAPYLPVSRQRLIVTIVALLVMTASVASALGRIESGSGRLSTEQLNIRGFDRIVVPGSWQIEITQGRFDVSVTVDDNLVDDLRVERRGDALVFAFRSGVRIARAPPRASVSMPELNGAAVSGSGSSGVRLGGLELQVSGSGHISGIDCAADQLRATVGGSGAIRLSSCSVERADLGITGSGVLELVDGRQCRAGHLALRISGSGDADLRGCSFAELGLALTGSGGARFALSRGDLSGSISGSGSIRYIDDLQTVDVRTSGSGRVVKEG